MSSEAIRIRPAQPSDAESLRAVYAPYVERTAVTFEYAVPDTEEFARRVAAVTKTYPWLAAEENGQIAAYAYAGPFAARAAYGWAAEVSIYAAWDRRGEGLGRRLYAALEAALRAQGLQNLNACIAWPAADDPFLTKASARFHERMGYRRAAHFHRCGLKFGRWYDMIWMEKLIGAHETARPVIPFSSLPEEVLREAGIEK